MHVDTKCTVIKFAYRYSKRPLFSVITSHFFSVWKFFHLLAAKLDSHLYILSFFQVLGSSPDSSLTDVYTSPMGVKRAASTHSISSIGVLLASVLWFRMLLSYLFSREAQSLASTLLLVLSTTLHFKWGKKIIIMIWVGYFLVKWYNKFSFLCCIIA